MSQNAKVDLRIRRTRKLLRDALVALIEERSFEVLTIQDISERAMINRATFYRHYSDKNDLLQHCMDDVISELIDKLKPPPQDANDPFDAPITNLELMFEHIAENSDFYRVMLGKDGVGAFTARMRGYLDAVSRNRLTAMKAHFTVEPKLPEEMIISYLSSAHIGAIIWWVNNNMPLPPETMAKHIITLMYGSPFAAFGFTDPALEPELIRERLNLNYGE